MTMKNTITPLAFLIFLFGFSLQSLAQPNFPDDAEIFRDDVVGRVDILIHPDTLAWIYDEGNLNSDLEWHATFVFDNGTIHDTVHDIGFRLRGNTSRQSAKKSFKVSFNTFESGRKYYGIEKMNLNGEHNDPTVARSKMSWDLCRQARIPASRSSHVEVYINDDYYGLYINVEHVDEEFVDKRFNNNDGNLYKCLWPADLNYLGEDPDLYKFDQGGRRAYELKINEEADDYSDLAYFIDVINNTPLDDLPCELEAIFNVQDYLRIMAMDVFTANWDGYIWNKNNFYLYHNTETGKLEYIPYDLDNTYGIDWFSIDWGERDIYQWDKDGEYRPLYERLMQVQKYRDWYSYYFGQMMELMKPESYFTRLNEIRDQLYPYILDDDYYTYDYGFTPQNFWDAYDTGLWAHLPYGLKDYITARYNSGESQMEGNNIQPIINYLQSNHSGPGSTLDISVFVWDEDADPTVNLLFNLDNTGWETLAMGADGNEKYTGAIQIPSGESDLLFQIEATDLNGNLSSYPCDPVEINFAPGGSYPLFINEFLASNDTTNTDEAGEYDDWLELYNASEEPLWLGDKFLTDNLDNPNKWPMPDYTMQPQEFLLVWCDEDQDQGIFHTNFKISAGGENLGIFDSETTGFAPIDQIVFGSQQTDISYGRDPDAGENWIFYQSPTPGVSNLLSSTTEFIAESKKMFAWPNPVKGNTIYLNGKSSIQIINMSGQLWIDEKECTQVSIATLPPGIYLLKTSQGGVFKLIRQ